MKLFVSRLNIVFLILFLISTPAFSGQLHTWVDENGVTHMTSQPPPADTDSETIKYKNRKNTHKPSRDNFDHLRKTETRRSESIERLKLEKEFNQTDVDRKKQKKKDEIAEAKEDYEYAKEWESYYRERHRKARTPADRDYYYKKMNETDELWSKYRELINKYGHLD